MVYPGVGWVIWRTKEDLPEELVFKVAYLGQEQVLTLALALTSPAPALNPASHHTPASQSYPDHKSNALDPES